jgi:hypothetical protein
MELMSTTSDIFGNRLKAVKNKAFDLIWMMAVWWYWILRLQRKLLYAYCSDTEFHHMHPMTFWWIRFQKRMLLRAGRGLGNVRRRLSLRSQDRTGNQCQ